MDLGKPVTYNGLSLNTVVRAGGGAPTSGYLVERIAPEPSPPSGYLEKSALRDGLDAGDVFLGGRSLGLIVTVFGSTAGDFWDKTQGLLSAFSPTIAYDTDTASHGFMALDFFQPTANIATWPTSTFPNGIPMRYYLRCSGGPRYAIERDRDGGLAAMGRSKPFDIPLIARDPRKYNQTAITSAQFTTTNQTAVYRGDYWTYPIITFSLSATGHSAFTLNISGFDIQLNLSGQSSGTFTFDYAKRTLTLAGVSKSGLITASQGYAPVKTGATFKFTNPTGISSCSMDYREAWA